MALRSRGISRWFWGFGFRFVSRLGEGSGAEPMRGTAAELEWEPSE
uniref:Uncharacterized protein n=1 Tax=Arundo donax TaxID=35708 RepID=A0A0A9GC07_ARUDO